MYHLVSLPVQDQDAFISVGGSEKIGGRMEIQCDTGII
jgi:hypothetical protein